MPPNTRQAPRPRTPERGPARALPRPRPSALFGTDIWIIAAAYVACVFGLWAWHGGVSALTNNWLDGWLSLSQLSGLLASACGLFGVVLIARPRTLERHLGLDKMFVWHRYLGESMAVLLAVHIVSAVIAGTADGTGVWAVIRNYTGRQPYMAMATVGGLLIFVVTISSLKSIRRQMSYETWYFVHLTAYVALAISFGHEIVLGNDFADDKVARWFWVAIHVGVLAAVLSGRWGRTIMSVLRPLRVESVVPLGADISAITLGGPGLNRLEAHGGQFCMLRPLRPGLWWQSHPFSLSAAPTTRGLRFTIKDRGDASGVINSLKVGTRVAVEGPYGVATPDVAVGSKVLCIVGGVGVAPARAMLELLTPDQQPIVLYRARSKEDLVHLDEMQQIAQSLRGEVLTLVGPSVSLAVKDPFSGDSLTRAIPDVAERTVFVCGPDSLVHAARRGLKAAGVPTENVHFEMVWW